MSRLVKLQRRYGSEWYLENDEGHVSWLAPMVKEHIERLEDENTKLRKELELAGHIAVSNVVASIGREESLEDENAKLRELCVDMWHELNYTSVRADDGTNKCLEHMDEFDRRMRNLDILEL